MISIFLNLLRFDLWPKMWSILKNVPCALEKKVYSSAFGWNILKLWMRSISSNVSFKTCVSLLIFCFDDLSIGVSEVLKSPTVTVLLSISPFSLCFMRCSYVGCIDIYNCYVFLLEQLMLYPISFELSCFHCHLFLEISLFPFWFPQ